MPRTALILDGAKLDFEAIRRRVLDQFGVVTWTSVNARFRSAVRRVVRNPKLGSRIEALEELGEHGFRKILVEQTWIVYEFDDERLLVHMFLGTRQDFLSHLETRILRA